jgi:VIT1/CCC1 family predicted Fe2+/Mn2+ transporter
MNGALGYLKNLSAPALRPLRWSRVRSLHAKGAGGSLRDFVYGAIDGTVTTFAVVAGVAGAQLRAEIVIVLGMANLIADGFSMAVGNFLATRAESQQRDRDRRLEFHAVAHTPEDERDEIRQIFAAKGFKGQELERVVNVITSDDERWVDTMMTEELGYAPRPPDPLVAAATTFGAFVLIGSLPLVMFVVDALSSRGVSNPFIWSSVLTGGAFFVVGALKSRFVDQRWWVSGLETLLLGGAAATIAFGIGMGLRGLLD